MRTTLRLAGIFVVLLTATPALAQFIAPMRYNEGPGIKLSDALVFHPGILLEGRYDSNALYQDTGATGAGYLRVIGHFDLATTSPQRRTDGEGQVFDRPVDFRLKSALSFRNYFSSNDNVTAQRAFEVDAGMALSVLPRRVFSFDVIVSSKCAKPCCTPTSPCVGERLST